MHNLSKRKIILWSLALLAAFAAGGFSGWLLANLKSVPLPPVRQGGYGFVNPLLVCSRDTPSQYDEAMNHVLQTAVAREVSAGDINTASVYYRNFTSNSWTSLNDGEKYYPASLGKVPLMIAYFALEEADNNPVLEKQLFYAGSQDANAQQEIKPVNPILPGHAYSVGALINTMIKDSDNNATELLFANIDTDYIKSVFADLNVPYLAPNMPPENFMTVSDFAFFFRVLYNGTYISHVDSEKALQILSESTFDKGLAAGVPSGTKVAHKFGLVSVAPDGKDVASRELHDCGIVYAGESPYLLCVMTKSSGSLQNTESAIASISSAVYQAAAAGK